MRKFYIIMFGISCLLVIVAVISIALFGLNLGADFKGGSVLELSFIERPELMDIENMLSDVFEGRDFTVNKFGEDGFAIRTTEMSEDEHQKLSVSINSNFANSGAVEQKFDSIGPIVGKEMKNKSITAIIIVLLAIIIYIAFVFRRLSPILSPWVLGAGALGALAHDILIPVGVFSVLGYYHGVEISAIFVAALLTILGYSVSDTVVVFDRIRENIVRKGIKDNLAETAHISVVQTLSRSLNTSMTTLLPLLAIYFFGGESIKFFALALIVGIAAGAYSSIFVAVPLVVFLSKKK